MKTAAPFTEQRQSAPHHKSPGAPDAPATARVTRAAPREGGETVESRAEEEASTAGLITHPVRARVLVGLMGRELTTRQIAALVPGVPRATLYRHVRRLLLGGLLSVVREVPVRGTMEKVYTVRRDAGRIPGDAAASASDHLRHFTTFVDTMTELYRAYLESEGGAAPDPPRDTVMVATPLYLDDAGFARFREALGCLTREFRVGLDGEPPGAARHVLWVAAIPDRRAPGPP